MNCRIDHTSEVILQNKIWFVTDDNSILMNVSVEDGSVEAVCRLPDGFGGRYKYRGVVTDGENLYLLPCTGTRLYIYNTIRCELEEVVFPTDIMKRLRGRPGFFRGFVEEDTVAMFGFTSIVVFYNRRTGTFNWFDLSTAETDPGNIQWDIRYGIRQGEKYYFQLSRTDVIFWVDDKLTECGLATGGHSKQKIKYSFLVKGKNAVYSVNEYENEVRISEILSGDDENKTDMIIHISGKPDDYTDYNDGVAVDDDLYLIPGYSDRLIRIDMNTGKYSELSIPELSERRLHSWTACTADNRVIIIIQDAQKLAKIGDNGIEILDLVYTKDFKKRMSEILREIVRKGNIIQEGEWGIEDVLDIITGEIHK